MDNRPTSTTYVVSRGGPSPQLYRDRNRTYLIPFSYDSSDQIAVYINGVPTTEFTSYSSSLTLNERPAYGDKVTISRVTAPEAAAPVGDDLPVYSAGESIKAGDLNEANSILVQKIQELEQEIAVMKAQATV